MERVFFNYIDWTTEEIPRPFYVGKGVIGRIQKRERNVYWQNIAAKFGWRREVAYATKDESHAFNIEKRWIAEMGTFEGGECGVWGANLTEGGEGRSGAIVSQITRLKMSKSRIGHVVSDVTRQKLSIANVGHSPWSKGKKQTSEHTEKIRAAQKGRPCHFKGKHHSPEATANMRAASKKGAAAAMAKLTLEQVQTIRSEHARGVYQDELAVRFHVSQGTISRIITRERYK